MTWILILIIYIPFNGGAGITAVPNFPTREECIIAAKESQAGSNSVSAYCIHGPTK